MAGVVALVGRPNVGKSTLFNRLISEREAIVDNQPGVTRDRNYGQGFWGDVDFTVIDTGGYVREDEDAFSLGIRSQVEIALREADVVLFLVDVSAGITPEDEDVAEFLRRQQPEKLALVVNKTDNSQRQLLAAEFYALGLEQLFPVSAVSGSGTGELLDWVVQQLPDPQAPIEADTETPRIAVVGRPNVGKSSLINALLGQERHLVTDIAGTTRDSIDVHFTGFGLDVILVDTAGLRRKARVQDEVEFYSGLRTLKALERSRVALLLLDAERGLESQDLYILAQAERMKKGIVIAVNKWDAVPNGPRETEAFRERVYERIAPRRDIPVLFVSALERKRLLKALETAQAIALDLRRRIPTRELNETLIPLIEQQPPPTSRGRMIRIKFVTQADARTPTFVFFANYPQAVRQPYRRYLENQIRKHFGFAGCPVTILLRQK